MKITIHRGTDQIGGCVTEYEYDSWKLFVDYGEQLPGASKSDVPLEVEGLTKGDLSKSALLITHYHGDHMGKIAELAPNILIYMGKISRDIIATLANYLKTVDTANAVLLQRLPEVNTFSPGEPFKFGPFTIMPVMIDHSAFDAYAFKIEADDVKVFHTGDFRTHGFRSGKLPKVIDKFVGRVDYLVCEATNVARPDATNKSEHELQTEFAAAFNENKYHIVYLSSTNIDRLFSLYHAALQSGRCFIVDKYQKQIMDFATQRNTLWGKSRMYRYREYEPMTLMVNGPEFLINEKFKAVLEEKGYVLIARANPRFDALISKLPGESKQRYLSMWNGYLNPDSAAFNPTLAYSIGSDFRYMHTSGHCDMKSLHLFFEMLNPRAIIPVHTDKPEAFAKLFSDKWPIVLLNDGESINPISTRYFDTVSASVIAVKPAEENLSAISNEGNREWWSLDIGYIGAFINSDDALQILKRVRYAPERLLGYDVEEEEDMFPFREDVYNLKFELLTSFEWGGHLPGEKNFQEMGWLKPGDKVLAIVNDGFYAVIPCEIVGPITEEFMKSSIDEGPFSYEETELYDWDWDCVIAHPLVRLKDELEEMPEKIIVHRTNIFPYRKFEQ